MSSTRIAVFGTGYWAQFQIAAWQSVGAEVAAVWNRTREKAENTARRFGIPAVYGTPEEVFEQAAFDIADIIADVDAHEPLTLMAARYGKAVICQKPMAGSLEACIRMVDACRSAGVWFAIHENFRYQPQFEPVKALLASGELGRPLHAHVQLKSPDHAIISKQPALAAMDHMALRDMGPHIFDVVRYLFGDIRSVYSKPVVSYPDIGAADTALSLLDMENGMPVLCSLAHRFRYKVFAQCEHGALTLDADNVLWIERDGETRTVDTRTWPVLPYIPADDWAIHGGHVFAAIPRCLNALLERWRKGLPAETSGEDNLRTMRAVFAAIRSQDEGRAVYLNEMKA
jgi:predicted dehydrogenase